jgi:hypothetical protein
LRRRNSQQSGNVLAGTVLSVNDTTTDDVLLQLKTQLEDAKAQSQDEVAMLILGALDAPVGEDQAQQAPADPAQTYPFGMGQQQPATTPVAPAPDQAGAVMQQGATPEVVPVPPANNPPVFGQGSAGPSFQSPPAPTMGMSSGMAALNEALEQDVNPFGTPVESDGENVS